MRTATQEIYYFFSNGIIKNALGKHSSYIFFIFSVPGKFREICNCPSSL